jgi:iron complex outermembrane receptor protein
MTTNVAIRRTAIASAVAAALGMASVSATAQDEEASSSGGLEEIVVTARYREENLQTTPLAISAFSVADIEQRQLVTVDDIGLAVPNAFFRQSASNFGPTATIGLRGMIQTDFSYAFEPAVGIYIDDVYHGTLTGASMDLMDLERLEVLRGPQGTLFGKNSLGGAVRLITKKPQGNNTGSIEATYGEFDRVEFKGVADFALIPDKLFARVVGTTRKREGWGKHLDFTCEMIRRGTPELAGIGDGLGADGPDEDDLPDPVPVGSIEDNAFSFPQAVDPRSGSCALGSLGGEQSESARLALRYLASDRLELNITTDYVSQNDDPPVETLLTRRGGPPTAAEVLYDNGVVFPKYGIRFTADDRFLTGDPYSHYGTYGDIVNGKQFNTDQLYEAWGASFTADYKITDRTRLKFVTAYRTYEADWINDSDLTPFGFTQTDSVQEHEQFQAEVQLTGSAFADALEWTTGLFWYDSDSRYYNTTQFEAFVFTGQLQNFTTDDLFTSRNVSAFVHVNYKLTDRVSISAGARYTDEDKTNDFRHFGQIVVPNTLEFGDSRVDYKVGVDFRATDALFFYGQVATGFRSPGVTPRIFTIGQLQPLPGEEVVNYELGAKLDLFDRKLRLNAAAFYMDYDPRLLQVTATQCNNADNPDPGEPFFLTPGQLCPAGTERAGQTGFSWFYFQSAPGTMEGFELEALAFPIDRLQFSYTLGYNKFEGDAPEGDRAYRHKSALLQPEWNMSAGVQYGIPVGNAGVLTPRLDWYYQSHRTNGPVNQPQRDPEWIIPSYGIYNARLTYDSNDSDWQIALSVTNLTDKFYWQQLQPAVNNAGTAPTAGRVGTPGRPREWAITFKKNF